MHNAEIAKVFSTLSDLLELKGENVFKVRAYQRAARAIEQLSRELSQIAREFLTGKRWRVAEGVR